LFYNKEIKEILNNTENYEEALIYKAAAGYQSIRITTEVHLKNEYSFLSFFRINSPQQSLTNPVVFSLID